MILWKGRKGNLFFVLLKPSELKVKEPAAGFISVQSLRTKVSFIFSFRGRHLALDIFPRQSVVETVSCQSVVTVGAVFSSLLKSPI